MEDGSKKENMSQRNKCLLSSPDRNKCACVLLLQEEDHRDALPVVSAVPESYTSELTLHMTPIRRQTGDLAGRHISLKQPADSPRHRELLTPPTRLKERQGAFTVVYRPGD